MTSAVYQLGSDSNSSNKEDETNYSHTIPRRLTAEQLLDSQSQVTGMPLQFTGYPEGTHASQLPGALSERKRDQSKTELDQVLEVFGKPARLLTSECERSCEPTMSQVFQLINGHTINEMINSGSVIKDLTSRKISNQDRIRELFWRALSREPSSAELTQCEKLLTASAADPKTGLQDICWGLLNSKEFVLRH